MVIKFFKRFARKKEPNATSKKALVEDLRSEFDGLYNQHIRSDFRTVEIINNLERLKRALAIHEDLHVDQNTISKLGLLFKCTIDNLLKRKICDVLLILAERGNAGAIFLAKRLLKDQDKLNPKIKAVLISAASQKVVNLEIREPVKLKIIDEDKG